MSLRDVYCYYSLVNKTTVQTSNVTAAKKALNTSNI